MNTRNNTKQRLLVGGILCLSLAFSACGDRRDKAQGPTATVQSAPPTTTLAAPTTSGQTTDATTVPTILYDDSAAAEFWEPVPEGMTPAEFQPDVLTREEVTKYVELPNPNPADWNIPEEGITAEYITRVLGYIQTLQSGLIRAGVAIGVTDPRVITSAGAPYRGGLMGDFVERLASATAAHRGNWVTAANLAVVDFEYRTVTARDYPCVFVHVTYDEVGNNASERRDEWVGLVRDGAPNPLNPTGWRQDTVAPVDTSELDDFSCDAWDSNQ